MINNSGDIYCKDFDNWNVFKKNLDIKKSKSPFFKERDIWWVSIGINVGFEENGKSKVFTRPVLILRKFSRDMFLGCPMSTKLKNNRYYLSVTLQGKIVSVLISQIRAFSSKRIWNKLGELDSSDYHKVQIQISKLFLSPSPKGESRG